MSRYRKVAARHLETERLRLEPLCASHAERIQSLFGNPAVLRYMAAAIPWPYPEDGAITFIESIKEDLLEGRKYFWAIHRIGRMDEGLIGVVGLTPDSDEDHRGFWLGEPYWRQGYMKEALVAVNDFAFDELEMPEMILNNAEHNVPSHRLKELAGAEIVETEEKDFVGGRFLSVRWRLTSEAWKANRHRFFITEAGCTLFDRP